MFVEHALLLDGFRGSAGYPRWKQPLHHFYDPFPIVEHFVPILGKVGTPPAVTASTPNQQ
jgi:hypothetical protein